MSIEERSAAEEVRGIFERAVSDGLRPELMAGATGEQVDAWAADQDVHTVPTAVREVLELIGSNSGLWFAGSSFGVDAISAEAKRHALATLGNMKPTLVDEAGILVLVEHQGYEFHVIDGGDIGLPNPPVWLVVENQSAVMHWPSVSDWFKFGQPNIKDYKFRLEFNRKRGRSTNPSWLHYFDFAAE
ncbi:hypothetical protein ACFRAQ_28835 [Nocardia sp. NPDC056611]|uniref:hypothetical protein n=1 Tax=Nocardia sp. NPDC056611 TaxID=3345877 RepID=UPI00366C73E3